MSAALCKKKYVKDSMQASKQASSCLDPLHLGSPLFLFSSSLSPFNSGCLSGKGRCLAGAVVIVIARCMCHYTYTYVAVMEAAAGAKAEQISPLYAISVRTSCSSNSTVFICMQIDMCFAQNMCCVRCT